MVLNVGSGVVHDAISRPFGHQKTHHAHHSASSSPSIAENSPPAGGIHPLLLLFYVSATCFTLMMAYFLDSSRRASIARKKNASKNNSKDGNSSSSVVPPGEWVRPLGNLETFMEVGGEYGSLNTVQAIWLSSTQPIVPQDVRNAIQKVAENIHILQVCVKWRGMSPWFKRMEHFAIDFEVEEDDVMAVFYTQNQKPYDMTKGPLWASRLVPLARTSTDEPYRAVLITCIHHCITDGFTNMLFSREVLKTLNASMTGKSYDVPLYPIVGAISDSLLTKKDWYYIFTYFCLKFYKCMIADYSNKIYFKGILKQPQTKEARTKVIRENFTEDQTKALVRYCKENGVTVHSCIMTTANLAFLKTIKERANYKVEAIRMNTFNCINMRRYYPENMKNATGCHISLEEKEVLISDIAAKSKDGFWALAKVFHGNLNDSLNVKHIPLKNTPLFRTSAIILHVNHELTRHGRKNRTDNHIVSTNMGNLKDILPGKYDGPVEITDILRCVSNEFLGTPFTLSFHTFMNRFMISVDHYTTKTTDEAAAHFFKNLTTYIANIAEFGSVNPTKPKLNGLLGNTNKTTAVTINNNIHAVTNGIKPAKEEIVHSVTNGIKPAKESIVAPSNEQNGDTKEIPAESCNEKLTMHEFHDKLNGKSEILTIENIGLQTPLKCNDQNGHCGNGIKL